jgi:hypothetical protein
VYGDTIDGASVVIAEEPAASAMIADFLGGSPSASSASIRIRVLNGNGIDGAAGRMSATLEDAGFEVAGLGNADSRDYTTTAVLVPAGSDAGERIVTEIGFGVVQVGSVDNGYDAVVIVGADAS